MIPWLAMLAHGASVTVSPGDNLNELTSSLQPGDVVTFNPGTYELTDRLQWTGVGTADEPIEFKGSGTVVLHKTGGDWIATLDTSSFVKIVGITFAGTHQDGSSSNSGYGYGNPSGLYMNNSTSVTVEDCVFQDLDGDALRIDGDSNSVRIHHNEIKDTTGTAINVGCGDGSCWMADSEVDFNLIHDVEGHGIDLSTGTQSSKFEHNVLFRTGDTTIVARAVEYGDKNFINGNALWDGQRDGIYVEGSALIQNNLIFQFEGSGIYSRDNYGSLGDLQISHNTIASTKDWAVRLDDWYDKGQLVFANNAVENPIGYAFHWNDNAGDPYNGGYTSTGYPDTENYISHNVVTGLIDGFDPVVRPDFIQSGGALTDFVDAPNLNFYPTTTSLLRDRGDPDGQAWIPEYDINGTQRDGASPDVGAYEYDGEDNVGWVVQEGFMTYEEHEARDGGSLPGGCCGAKASASAAFAPAPFLLLAFVRRRRR